MAKIETITTPISKRSLEIGDLSTGAIFCCDGYYYLLIASCNCPEDVYLSEEQRYAYRLDDAIGEIFDTNKSCKLVKKITINSSDITEWYGGI